MPRDANGNYTLPAGNPVVTDTNIESGWANTTMGDIGAELTDSLSRSGKGALTGPLQIIDEQTGVPGLAFGAEPTSGLKRSGTGDVRMQISGSDRMRWRAGASQVPEVQVAGVWKEVALLEAARKVMQGVGGETTVWFYNATVPAASGWELLVADANARNLTIAPGGATPVGGGTIGGSEDPTNMPVATTVTVNLPAATQEHVLTIDQIPAHNHSYQTFTTIGNQPSGGVAAQNLTSANSGSTGGGLGHSHNIGGTAAGTGSGAITPRYAIGVLGKLSA